MHRVVALVRAPQSTFELACAAEVFGIERTGLPVRYRFGVCAEQPGEVATPAGYNMLVTDGLGALDQADTVIIPGWRPTDEPPSPKVISTLKGAHDRGARLVSICTGAFALAYTGLLDDRSATTHWARTSDLAERFPSVSVEHNVLYVDHGDVATSAGSGAGIDLCLHLVRSDQGARYTAHVARNMVMPPHREGGQLQYTSPPKPDDVDGTLGPLLDRARDRLAEPLAVQDLAAQAGISSRTLARRFSDQLGTSPGRWLLEQRITTACELLETTDLPIETIARHVGLSSATNLRRRFLHSLGTTPGAYRRAFSPSPT